MQKNEHGINSVSFCYFRKNIFALAFLIPVIVAVCFVLVSGGVLVVGEEAAGCSPCKKLQKQPPSSKSVPPLDEAEPISASLINIFKTWNLLAKGLLLLELSLVLEESMTEREKQSMSWTSSLVRKKVERHSGAAILLQLMAEWQAVCNLWRSSHWSRDLPVLQRWSVEKVPECGYDSEGDPHWDSSSLGELLTTLAGAVHGRLSPMEGMSLCHGGLQVVFPLRKKEQQKQHGTDWDWPWPPSNAFYIILIALWRVFSDFSISWSIFEDSKL